MPRRFSHQERKIDLRRGIASHSSAKLERLAIRHSFNRLEYLVPLFEMVEVAGVTPALRVALCGDCRRTFAMQVNDLRREGCEPVSRRSRVQSEVA